MLTAAQLLALKNEINNDPRGYGFVALNAAGNDQGISDNINTVRDGTNPPTNPTAAGGNADGHISINKGSISTQDLLEALTETDVAALTQGQRDWIMLVASGTRVRVDSGSSARAGLLALFSSGTSHNNLIATATRNGSRAEELFGVNTVITIADIAAAIGVG